SALRTPHRHDSHRIGDPLGAAPHHPDVTCTVGTHNPLIPGYFICRAGSLHRQNHTARTCQRETPPGQLSQRCQCTTGHHIEAATPFTHTAFFRSATND